MQTLVDAVKEHARREGGRLAFRFLDQKGELADQLSYADLDCAAQRISGWVSQQGLTGRPVLLLFPTGADFIRAFLGCLYGRAIAVPSSLPSGKRHHMERVRQVVADSGASHILVSAGWKERLKAFFSEEGVSGISILSPEQIQESAQAEVSVPQLEDPAFIQYSSGSTGNPRGVVIEHGNLIHNIRLLQKRCETDRESVFGSWLPFFHDMGLIGIVLQSLYLGARAVILSPQNFIRRPALWLRMISEYGVEVAGGPNFAYEHCLRQVRDDQLEGVDLSRWRVAFNGAEPIRASTMQRFSKRFRSFGFRDEAHTACYGLAEATLCVACHDRREPTAVLVADPVALATRKRIRPAPEGHRFVACGRVNESAEEDMAVRIVDPDSGRSLPDNQPGEIWVSSLSVGRGYQGHEALSALTFRARIADEPQRRWLRTGDLGFIREGYLFVTGRLKDLIIVNGRNISPEDIEQAAMEVLPSTRRVGETVAVSVDDVGGESILLLQEINAARMDTSALSRLARIMTAHIARQLQISVVRVVFVPNGSIPRTTSGKKKRGRCRELLQPGRGLSVLHCEEFADTGPRVSKAGAGS